MHCSSSFNLRYVGLLQFLLFAKWKSLTLLQKCHLIRLPNHNRLTQWIKSFYKPSPRLINVRKILFTKSALSLVVGWNDFTLEKLEVLFYVSSNLRCEGRLSLLYFSNKILTDTRGFKRARSYGRTEGVFPVSDASLKPLTLIKSSILPAISKINQRPEQSMFSCSIRVRDSRKLQFIGPWDSTNF